MTKPLALAARYRFTKAELERDATTEAQNQFLLAMGDLETHIRHYGPVDDWSVLRVYTLGRYGQVREAHILADALSRFVPHMTGR